LRYAIATFTEPINLYKRSFCSGFQITYQAQIQLDPIVPFKNLVRVAWTLPFSVSVHQIPKT
jgi:hypothetical protein